MENGKVLSIAEACKKLDTTVQSLYRWRSAGLINLIPAQAAGVKASEVERILAARKGAGKNEA